MLVVLAIFLVPILFPNVGATASSLNTSILHVFDMQGTADDILGNVPAFPNNITFDTVGSPDGNQVARFSSALNRSYINYSQEGSMSLLNISTVCTLMLDETGSTAIFNRGEGVVAGPGFELYCNNNNAFLYTDASLRGSFNGACLADTWNIYCTDYNGTDMNIWRNGTRVLSNTSVPSSNVGSFVIGSNPPKTELYTLNGAVRYIYVWNRTLTEEEHQELYNGSKFSYYPFIVADSSPSTNTSNNSNTLSLITSFSPLPKISLTTATSNGSGVFSCSSCSHNSLLYLQGGIAGEYYHLSEALWNKVVENAFLWNNGSTNPYNITNVTIVQNYISNQTGEQCPIGNYSYGYYTNGTPLCRSDVDTDTDTNTNAETECANDEYYDGNGNCYSFNATVQALSLDQTEADGLYVKNNSAANFSTTTVHKLCFDNCAVFDNSTGKFWNFGSSYIIFNGTHIIINP